MTTEELPEQIRWIESTIKKNVPLHLVVSDSKILLETMIGMSEEIKQLKEQPTLRDQFAMQALNAYIPQARTKDDALSLPELSYLIADAMMEARK